MASLVGKSIKQTSLWEWAHSGTPPDEETIDALMLYCTLADLSPPEEARSADEMVEKTPRDESRERKGKSSSHASRNVSAMDSNLQHLFDAYVKRVAGGPSMSKEELKFLAKTMQALGFPI